jgi:hypothetical protein
MMKIDLMTFSLKNCAFSGRGIQKQQRGGGSPHHRVSGLVQRLGTAG